MGDDARKRERLLEEAQTSNNCLNVLYLEGADDDIAKFRDENSGGDHGVLSFARAIPLPPDLDDEAQCDWASIVWGTPRDTEGGEFRRCYGSNDKQFVLVTRATPPLAWLAVVAKRYPALKLSLKYTKHRTPWTGTMRCEGVRIVSHIEYEPVDRLAQPFATEPAGGDTDR